MRALAYYLMRGRLAWCALDVEERVLLSAALLAVAGGAVLWGVL